MFTNVTLQYLGYNEHNAGRPHVTEEYSVSCIWETDLHVFLNNPRIDYEQVDAVASLILEAHLPNIKPDFVQVVKENELYAVKHVTTPPDNMGLEGTYILALVRISEVHA